ncbi:MAG TPA: sigma-70 family RNA polymerase sigma factor [Candidatus Polarisedimenticolaceae bacterium]|nr:sigma-70 family RNA polymerase sigma factor [Candidatus Polarisedimenticolaceae bacterium]
MISPQPRVEPQTRTFEASERAAMWELARAHLGYIVHLAREFRTLGIPLEDLQAEGVLGLLEAAERFDPARGVKFLSYAAWWIRKRMRELIARDATLVRMPRYQLERLRVVRLAERELEAELGRPPSTEEVARLAGLSACDVEVVHGLSRREVSLSESVSRSGQVRLEDTLAQSGSAAPDFDLLREDAKALVRRLLEHLTPRRREILALRFGLDGEGPQPLGEIAGRLGLSRERVRQLEQEALRELRRLVRLRALR